MHLGVASFLTLIAVVPGFAQIGRREFFDPGAAIGDGLGQSVTATALYTIAGAPGDDTPTGVPDAGSVSVFHAANGRLFRKIIAPDGAAGDAFGSAVAASGDYLVVGAPRKESLLGPNAGAAYLFRLSTGALIRRLGSGDVDSLFGSAVAVWGNHIVVSAPTADTPGAPDSGRAWLYALDNPVAVNELVPSSGFGTGATFGKAVAVDNHIIAVGAPNHTEGLLSQTGAVFLFTVHPVTGVPSAAPKVILFDATSGDGFGWSLALHGNTMAVGAPFRTNLPGAPNGGRVHLHANLAREIAGVGSTASPVLAGYSSNLFYGSSMGLGSAVGLTGAPLVDFFDPPNNGTVLLFGNAPATPSADSFDAGFFTYAPDLAPGQRYGTSAAVYGNRLVVGAPGDGTNGIASAGAVFQAGPLRSALSAETYTQSQRLGMAAPGTAGATHASFIEAIAGNGHFVLSSLEGPGVTAANGKAIFDSSQLEVNRRLRTGTSVPPGVTLKNLYGLLPGKVPTGVQGMAVLAGTGVTTANDLALFQTDGSSHTLLLREGGSIGTGTLGRFLQVRASLGFDAAATLALRPGGAVTAARDSALSVNLSVVQEGIDSSSEAVSYGQFSRVAMAGNRIIYPCALQAAPAGDAMLETRIGGGGPLKIARKGEPAPGPGALGTLTSFQSFLGEAINGAGGYAFRATIALASSPVVTVANNEGLWANNGPAGVQQLCVRKGDPHPGLPGVSFKRFLQFGVDSSSEPRLIFLAQLQGTGVTANNDLGLWLFFEGTLTPLLREGDYAPGNERGRIGVIQRLDIDPATRTYGVLCSLVPEAGGIGAGDNQALLAGYFGPLGPGGTALSPAAHVLGKSQRFLRQGADRVQSIGFLSATDPTGALACGLGQSFGPNRIVCQVQFSKTDKEVISVYCTP